MGQTQPQKTGPKTTASPLPAEVANIAAGGSRITVRSMDGERTLPPGCPTLQLLQPQHGHLDDVGGGPLDGMVDRFPFGPQPRLQIAAGGLQLEDGEVATAAEEGLHITV